MWFFKSKKKLNYIDKVYNDDIFLVSYPKSGNTWMRFFLSIYKNGGKALAYDKIEEFIPSVHKSSKQFISEIKKPRIIKSHFTDFESYTKILYIVRDGRDSLVSYYHYLQELKGFKGSFDDFYFSNMHSGVGEWHSHVQAAINYKRKHKNKILITKYEDMLNCQNESFKSILDFCHFPFDNELFKRSMENSAFEKLKKNQDSNGVVIEGKNINFFRKGSSGQWPEYFNDEIASDFLRKSKEAMDYLKYKYD